MTSRRSTQYLLWALLAAPAALLLHGWATAAEPWPGDFLRPTGEWSARLIILALMVTPLSRLLPSRAWVKWLLRHRRALGVAAFAYALLHLLFYMLDMESVRNMVAEAGAPGIWTGWAAWLCLLPLALTSNDAAMRALKAGWKRLQRLAYPAAFLSLAHWILVHDGLAAALISFAPLAALQLYRIIRFATERSPAPTLTRR
ncbi:MAG TPA: ferric reductase-like transmembrane domain-containing protein [Allosphingosinicella sp.]